MLGFAYEKEGLEKGEIMSIFTFWACLFLVALFAGHPTPSAHDTSHFTPNGCYSPIGCEPYIKAISTSFFTDKIFTEHGTPFGSNWTLDISTANMNNCGWLIFSDEKTLALWAQEKNISAVACREWSDGHMDCADLECLMVK